MKWNNKSRRYVDINKNRTTIHNYNMYIDIYIENI